MHRAIATVVLLLAPWPAAAQREPAVQLKEFAKDSELWTESPDLFMSRYRDAEFRWIAPNETARSTAPDAGFGDLKVWETLVYFRTNAVRQVVMSLYNRGDAGEMTQHAFNDLLSAAQTNLSRLTGTRGTTPQELRGPANVSIMRQSWTRSVSRLDLEWSFTPEGKQSGILVPYRAEYIRLLVSPLHSAPGSLDAATGLVPGRMSVINLRANVKKETNGDMVLAGVPMVDQGEKGYCAAAVTERVLRYYGQDIDQHKVAQIAGTSSQTGTNPEDLVIALRRIAVKLDLNVKEILEFSYKDFEKLVDEYNRLASRDGEPTVQISSVIVVTDLYQDMDLDILRRARAKRAGEMARFQTSIQENIASGIPLLWAVVLGKVQEKPDLNMVHTSGHMRMIIGYNLKTSEIIYTDTWGPGHERKTMSMADAWTISTALYTIKPWGVR